MVDVELPRPIVVRQNVSPIAMRKPQAPRLRKNLPANHQLAQPPRNRLPLRRSLQVRHPPSHRLHQRKRKKHQPVQLQRPRRQKRGQFQYMTNLVAMQVELAIMFLEDSTSTQRVNA